MPVCSFCKNNYEFPRGVTVIQRDGNAKYFCGSKCRKNSEMGRMNKKVKWVKKSDVVKDEKKKKDDQRALRIKEGVKVVKKKKKK